MPEQRVYSPQEVDFGEYEKMFWVQAFGGDGSVVPADHTREITTSRLTIFRSRLQERWEGSTAPEGMPAGSGPAQPCLNSSYLDNRQ